MRRAIPASLHNSSRPFMPTQTIAVAMSGGVDSSTVAAMLRAEGHNVVGLTMQLWNQRRLAGHEGMPEQVQGRCCSIDDVYDARRVAEDLDIPYYVVNHEERFERDVVRPFIDEYLSGRTPIPLGNKNKQQVRERAREHPLALAEKPDSQEICFVPGGDYKRFIDAYLAESGEALPDTAGELVTTNGEVIGEHSGIHNFTVGQRKGLGIATGSPLYVIQINGQERQVVVGGDEQLYSRNLRVNRLNWIAFDELDLTRSVEVKIRNRHQPAKARLERCGEDEVLVTFEDQQRAITPGQAA